MQFLDCGETYKVQISQYGAANNKNATTAKKVVALFLFSCAGIVPRPVPVVPSEIVARRRRFQAARRSGNGERERPISRETKPLGVQGCPLPHTLPKAKYSVLCLPSD